MLALVHDLISWIRGDFRAFYNSPVNKGFSKPVYSLFEEFYKRHLYMRTDDCFGRIVRSNPGSWISLDLKHLTKGKYDFNQYVESEGEYLNLKNFDVDKQQQTQHNNEKTSGLHKDDDEKSSSEVVMRKYLNLSSYNYLGFAENPQCVTKADIDVLYSQGVSLCSTPSEFGTNLLVKQLEKEISKFVDKEDAIVFGMCTNFYILFPPSRTSLKCRFSQFIFEPLF